MAISLRATGTWAEYTTDMQTVAIPGSPAAGDRMFLWVQWKDFAITLAQPNGWTTVVNSFADGAVSTGNGLGSISQAVFYRDWQSGDTAPTLDWSTTTGLLAEAVITIFAKGAGEVWKAPTYVTAAWPATSTTQTVSASAAAAVPDNSVVVAGIGLRDDSATFTRAATTGIDVSSGITWSADYVESPATHYSTTTGNDHSGDLGHRMVTTGGSGTSTVTLRVTATITAAETGSVVWVTEGVDTPTTVTPSTLAIAISTFAPTVTATQHQLVTPTTKALTITAFAPTVTASDHKTATPTTKALALTTFAPQLRLGVVPSTRALALSTFAPTVTVSSGVVVTPSTIALTTTTFAPVVSASDHKTVTPTTRALSLTTFAPVVSTTTNLTVTPGTAALVLAMLAPTVTATGAQPSGGGKGRLMRPVVIPRDIEEEQRMTALLLD